MAPSPVPARLPASQAAFLDDVRRTLRAWRTTPLLPGAVVLVAAVTLLGGAPTPALSVPTGLLGLLLVGSRSGCACCG